MDSERERTICDCFHRILPGELIFLIISIVQNDEQIIIDKLNNVMEMNYINYKFTNDVDFIKFYGFCLNFAHKHGLSSSDFDLWCEYGLNIGFKKISGDILHTSIWTSAKGAKIYCHEVSCIFNYKDYTNNRLLILATPVIKFIKLFPNY